MSNQHAPARASDRRGTHRPPSLPVLMQAPDALRALLPRRCARRRISVSWMAQSAAKMAIAA